MPSLSELRTKISGIKSIQQITKAMKMIASVKLAQVQKQLTQARRFQERIQTLIGVLANPVAYNIRADQRVFLEHPLVKPHQTKREGVVIITADKGLCGSFNMNIMSYYQSFLKRHALDISFVFMVGKKGVEVSKQYDVHPYKEYSPVFSPLSYRRIASIAEDIVSCYLREKLHSVTLIYTLSRSILMQHVMYEVLLPIKRPENIRKGKPYWDSIFEPDTGMLLDRLLTKYVQSKLFTIFNESYLSELSARMTTMDNASRNAQDLIESTTLTMNKIRQGSITRELAEIVAAGEAV